MGFPREKDSLPRDGFEFLRVSAPNLSPTKHLEALNQPAPNIAHVSQGSFTRGIVQHHMTLCILGVKIYMTPSVTYTTTDVKASINKRGKATSQSLHTFSVSFVMTCIMVAEICSDSFFV